MAFYYGVDTSAFSGKDKNLLDWTFNLLKDPYDVLVESAVKRITTRQGVVSPPTGVFWDTSTMDIRDYLLSSISNQDAAMLKTRMESLFETELRYAVEVAVTFAQSTLTIQLDLFPSTSEVPIRVILTADSNQVSYERVS